MNFQLIGEAIHKANATASAVKLESEMQTIRAVAVAKAEIEALEVYAQMIEKLDEAQKKFVMYEKQAAKAFGEEAEQSLLHKMAGDYVFHGEEVALSQSPLPALEYVQDNLAAFMAAVREVILGSPERLLAKHIAECGDILRKHGLIEPQTDDAK